MAPKPRAPAAQKSLYRPELQVFLGVLRTLRERTELNQTDFAQRLGRSQTYVSAAERGAVRLDGLQLMDWVRACDADLREWADLIESQLTPVAGKPSKSKNAGVGKKHK
ncbi:helix-turn-helix transcriptional regulator [Frateuria sp. Soil773]|uniref:helix-turn-helix domain-containing protein n=1 Tax=Frateuria sp. Soil773 TaxID=1736407 RepID=UPI0012F94D14|nr:helix-turn-helix transcriptional regulator [Frateuria sp. Soil773]